MPDSEPQYNQHNKDQVGHMEEWRVVQGFPSYSVSNTGLIRSDIEYKNGNTGRIIQPSKNQRGLAYVGLMKNGVQHKRSVALMVAHAFVLTARPLAFNTPINLNGDRFDNHASNLLWRPLWFARKYFRQFAYPHARIPRPIVEVKTEQVFENSWDAALTHGLLDEEIFVSMVDKTYVWPTYQRFEVLR
jgi:hypothetical protein